MFPQTLLQVSALELPPLSPEKTKATDSVLAKETLRLLNLAGQSEMYSLITKDKVTEKKYAVGA
jgi:hypothetical protein